ncbi:MAG: hypothetical protein HUU55_19150 [Myxococcales bacterium]|nr:hypothetical protein [Myxococcales bacterium]
MTIIDVKKTVNNSKTSGFLKKFAYTTIFAFCAICVTCDDGSSTSIPNGDTFSAHLECPAPTGGGQSKIEAGLDAAWAAADPQYTVRLLIELIYKADVGTEVTNPNDPIELAAFKELVAAKQACTASFLESIGAEIVVQSTLNTTIIAKCNRFQGLQVAGYPDVEKISAADVYPPPAGSAPCGELGQSECLERSDCSVILGQVVNEEEKCINEPVPLGCATKILSGGGTTTWALAPNGQCAKFPNNLVPSGWSTGPGECTTVRKFKDCGNVK